MIEESRKWMILVATTWIQAFTGTNFDFSSYSSDLKSVLNITQVQLNYLSVASDLGKAFGWCSGVSLLYFPLWVVVLLSAFMGLVGYGLQWLVIQGLISLPYIVVFFLCLTAGCSICFFNTICYVLCIRNFPANRALALSLSTSFNGVSAALYTLIANAINSNDDALYLLLNAIIPILVSGLALIPILRQPQPQPLSADAIQRNTLVFLCLNILAIIIGLYLLLLNSLSSNATRARIFLLGAVFLLILQLFLPSVVHAREWDCCAVPSSFCLYNSSFNAVDPDEVELHKELIEYNASNDDSQSFIEKQSCFAKLIEKDQLTTLGQEHTSRLLVRRWDFWLYYVAYFFGGTIGLVYSNNLGQISQSLGLSSQTSSLVTVYSACSFFGRLLSGIPDFFHEKMHFARTGWFAIALVPTPIAFIFLALSGSEASVRLSTGLIGLSSGFIFSAAVSITSELFGPNSVGINHNIVISNIPIGSLLYGLLAALIYDSNADSSSTIFSWLTTMSMCMGRKCYLQTFIIWGSISFLGLVSSTLLYLRTKQAYRNVERNRNRSGNSY
ncbi:hypothetical protein L6164_000210 [Bauhinia variegata]|uniref:Uncharacterized protein n=1 Tax=Bauhinia variegata TaxID=167791 RepID=A0ACB9Q5T5_BAUVA|nr:hypothetical protein L6164_000210 [Bauhinia variegata]